MTELHISQAEANRLIAIEKQGENNDPYWLPVAGVAISIPLVSTDLTEKFLIDIRYGRANLLKGTNQLRAQVIVLLRLDFNGSPHRNPDGEVIHGPHLHEYREGFGDKWAKPLPDGLFSDLNDGLITINEFMRYCHVTTLPTINRRLI